MLVFEHFGCNDIKNQIKDAKKRAKLYYKDELQPSPIKGVYGIELEWENYAPGIYRQATFALERDGSLKIAGVEVVSFPLDKELFPYFIMEIKNLLKNQNIQTSIRTSTHVHLNVQDFTLEQLKTFIATYLVCESAFFDAVDPTRKGNTYCYPLTSTGITWDHVLNPREEYKYSALNTHHLVDFGTVEFRHMHGTTDMGELTKWVKHIDTLRNNILETDTKEIEKEINSLNVTSHYFDFVFRMTGLPPNLAESGKQREMRNNVLAAKLFMSGAE